MKKSAVIAILLCILFMVPSASNPQTASFSNEGLPLWDDDVSLSAGGYPLGSGMGQALDTLIRGTIANGTESPVQIDSSSGTVGSIELSGDYSSIGIGATIDSLSMTVTDTLRNPNWNSYHDERWHVSNINFYDDLVDVPDSWTLVKSVGYDDPHPLHGDWELNDDSYGYSGSRGWRFEATIGSTDPLNPEDAIYLSQFLHAPWRDVYEIRIRFHYYVSSTSDMYDQVHLFFKLGDLPEQKFKVFESGDTTDTWIQTSVTFTSSDLTSIAFPNALLFSIGLGTDVSGTLSGYREAYAYVDEIEIEMDVRPFPEQIDLTANNTAVVGSIPGDLSAFVPDNDGRDCWDYTSGIDLDGYNNDGRPEWGVWGTYWNTSSPFEIGLQFPLDIPQGAVIEKAYVEMESSGGSGVAHGRVQLSSAMAGGGDIEAFSSHIGEHLEDAYSWLDAGYDWQPSLWTNGVRYATPDIAPLLQKVVSASDWSSGQYIALMVSYLWSSSYQTYNNIKGSTGYNGDNLGRLYVSYRIPLEEDVVLADREDARRNLQYKKEITVDHTKVAADLTNFPILIDIVDADLHTDAFPQGTDIAFMVDGQFVEHEIEFFDPNYSPTEAHLIAWVRVPFLSSSSDTVITMLYGGSDLQSLESAGVWSDYEIVHHMNEEPNGTLVDSSGNLHYGSSFGSMTSAALVTGAIGNSIDFDGSNDAITVGQIDTDEWPSFTVTGWVSQDVTGDDRIFSKAPDTNAANAIIHFAIDGSQSFRVRMRTDGAGGGSSGSVDAFTSTTPGNWVYLAWSWSAATASMRLYVNGTFDRSVARDGDTVFNSIVPFVIGNWQTGTADNRFFDGKIDEIRMTRNVLSDAWIETEFNNQLSPSTFYSIGSEQSNVVTQEISYASLYFSTNSPIPVNIGFTLAMDFEGSGKSLDENFNEGTTFHATNGTTTTEWIAKVLISPPLGITQTEVHVSYPMTEWRPVTVKNPIGQVLTNPTDWIFTGGTLTLLPSAIDVFGVYTLTFEGANYLSDLQLGVNGQALSTTGAFQVTDTLRFEASSLWTAGSLSQLYLTDPSGSIWSSPITNTTLGMPTHDIPTFRYRKTITIDNLKVYQDLTNFPVLIDVTDSDLDKAQNDGDDILFVQNGIILPHEIVEYSESLGQAHLTAWVRANLTNLVDTEIEMYYGNTIVGPQEQPAAVWSNDYVGVWHLEESPTGTTGEIADTTDYGNDGTTEGSMNALDSVSAKIGSGLDFDEVDDLIRIGDSQSLDSVATQGTIQLWIWWDQIEGGDGNYQTIMESSNRFNGNPNDGFEWASQTDADHYFYPWGGNGNCYNLGTNPFTDQTWHHLAVTLQYSTKTVQIYVDGSSISLPYQGALTWWSQIANPADWLWGGDPGQPLRYFDGMFDEIRVSNVVRSAGWLATEFANQNNPTTFYKSIGIEQERSSYNPSFVKALDITADPGIWTATALFNDSTTGVEYAVGIYEREFIVKHDSSLTLQEPSDAISDRLTVATAGNWIYVEYELSGDINAEAISGATVTLNWSVSGVPTQIALQYLGAGSYGKMLNTANLGDAKRWRVEIASSHVFYNDASEYFEIDLYHQTIADYQDVTTTPAGEDFEATLIFTDAYTGLPIEGGHVEFSDGSPVTYVEDGLGKYNISMPTGALSIGKHVYTFNLSKASSYYHESSVTVTFTLRQHYTSVSVQGDLTQPYGFNTDLHIVLIDLDTGGTVSLGDVASFTFTPTSYGQQVFPGNSYDPTLITSAWSIGTESVTLTVIMSDANFAAPIAYAFTITIRAHVTSVSISGEFVQPYGNTTPLTIILWDHDLEAAVPIGDVGSFTFTKGVDVQVFSDPVSYSLILDTSTWSVGANLVTLSVDITPLQFLDPTDYGFTITIRRMTIVLYHDPSDLVFAEGDDFNIDLRVNVSEPGASFGLPVTGLIQGEFSVPGYPFSIDTTEQAIGRYGLTILWSNLGPGDFTIVVYVTPIDNTYGGAQVTIHIFFTEVQSSLTSPTHPQVTTPFATDVQLTLNYTDIEREAGIAGATIWATGITIYGIIDVGNGIYTLWLNVTGYAEGTHSFSISADKAGYQARSLIFSLRIRIAYTYAIPSVGALDIPIGNSPVFYVEYWDIDHDVPVDNSSSPFTRVISTWHNFSVTYIPGEQRYRIMFMTSDADPLQSNQVYSFNFSKGENYQFGIFTVTVTIRTHNTDFRLTSAIEPTSNLGTIRIFVYYGDLDNGVGVDSSFVTFRVDNASGAVVSSAFSLATPGFYEIQVAADQFGLGIQTLTVYANWTGPFQKYQNKYFGTSALIVGLESSLALLFASEPTPYLEEMIYKVFYSELGGSGIDNLTGHVFIYVTFQGEIVDLDQVSIIDLSSTEPGNYSIQFNTDIFDRTGLIYMNLYVNWSKGVAPFYQNRTDFISVRVLPRDTLVSITPPSPVSYLEDASFTFTYEDIAGETSSYILDLPSLTVASNITFSYSETGGTFTFDFNTAQFGSLGRKAIRLDLTWAGAPFYVNRTGIIVYITILLRSTFLEYLTPPPTQYSDIVAFNVTWTDVAGTPYSGIEGASLSLWGSILPIPSQYYNWSEIGGGIYNVSLSATFAAPGTHTLRVRLTLGSFYISDVDVARQFTINKRITLLSAEPIRLVPYNSSIEVILYYQDLFTVTSIDNDTFDVQFEILTPGVWYYTISWEPMNEYYLLSIDTYNHPELQYGILYNLEFQMSYSNIAPYYASDRLVVEYKLRIRESSLELDTAPLATAYQNTALFTLFYNDEDADSGISDADVSVYLNATLLNRGSDYILTQGLGFYTFDVDTAALAGLGSNKLTIYMNWIGSPYHENLTTTVVILVRERSTLIEFTQPPSQTQYLDNVIFLFVFKDLDTGVAGGTPILGLTKTEIHLYCENGTPIASGLFSLVPVGNEYRISIASNRLSDVLDSNYILTVEVDWNGGTIPYYSDDSSTLRVSIIGRIMLVEPSTIETTPITGPLGTENMILHFVVSDASNGNPVENVIIGFSCQEQGSFTYWITRGTGALAGEYNITIDTLTLTQGIGTGTYHFELEIMWDSMVAPYYSDRPIIVMTGVVDEVYTNLQADAPNPAAPYIGQNVSIIVNYVDLDHGSIGIDSASITVQYIAGPATVWGLDINPTGTPGQYLIVFNTTNIPTDGSYTLRITASKPGYALLIVRPTITVQKIPTILELPSVSYTVRWTNTTRIFVYFNDTLNNKPISGATVAWSYLEFDDNFLEFAGTGLYYYDITADLDDAGPWVLSILAVSSKYQIATATITLVVLPLPSQLEVRIPDVAVQNVPRGDAVNVTVFLRDITNNVPIEPEEVDRVYIAFQGQEYMMSLHPNGSHGYYQGIIPGSATGVLDPRGYSVRVIAEFRNYELAAGQFGIYIEQIRTEIRIWDEENSVFSPSTIEFTAVYLEVVNFTVEVIAPAYALPIDNATVSWFKSGWDVNVNFTNMGGGIYQFLFNTSKATFGVYGLTFTALFPENPIFAEDAILISLIIQEIPTTVYAPIMQPVIWGWTGNFNFTYYDTHYDRGIENATVTYSYLSLQNLLAVDMGNGVYYVYIDTTILIPSSTTLYPILVTFQKGDGTYETATSGVSLQVLQVPTEILLNFSGATGGFTRFDGNVKVYELNVAFGGTIDLEFFYNDTDISDGYIGGIAGSFTNLTQLGGNNMFLKYPLLAEIGWGTYTFSFDTTQSWLFDAVGGEPAASPGNPYTFSVTLWLANRTAHTVRIQITIIEIPTSIEIINSFVNIGYGIEGSITIRYWDTWNDLPVTDANITAESSNSRWVAITGISEIEPGLYKIRFVGHAELLDIMRFRQTSEIAFTIFKQNYETRLDSDLEQQIEVSVELNPTEAMITAWLPVLTPVGLLLMVLIGLYVRVWSVPKRLRQINAQIKTLRKGRIPKPIPEAKSRQELIAELYNDTYVEMKLKRRPEQMPLESIEVAVPEMGELLIQLAILTNLNAEELEEFKADIAKMRLSEQAAFVREVIMQEAIRAARRDGITVDEILVRIQTEARARLSGEEGELPVKAVVEPDADAVVLVEEEEPEPEVEERITRKDFEEEPSDDRLSPYEIEELRKDLESRGVPPHEIDTIIDQAKVLPRELVDELVKSLEKRE